jgi:hypothetical protein
MTPCRACDEAMGDRCPHCRARPLIRQTASGDGGAFRQAIYTELVVGGEGPAPDGYLECTTSFGPILRAAR